MSLEKTLAEAGMHVIELATELPDQPFTPRRRLLWEVLRQAFADMDDRDKAIRRHTEEWFSAPDASKLMPASEEWWDFPIEEFTFLGLCEELGLTPLRIRTAAFDPAARAIILDRLRREWREGMTKQENAL